MKKLFINIVLILLLQIPAFSQVWEKVQGIPTPYNVNYWLDVMFLKSNPNYGWICGFNGRVLRTTDQGATWQGTTISGADHLESITFTSTTIGYTSGPAGLFKSTDGGASFTDITPAGSSVLWGNYFIDDNNGLVIGGGCLDNTQKFWRTTDGGTTWTVFTANENNSGLTHLILYSNNGLGYASSSGRIWKTTDGGFTWAIFSTTGSNLWQENIDNIGNSFIVPWSGTTCNGGGIAGGMRFSTDAGTSWNIYSTGQPMFGTKLLSDQKAWGCGYKASMYYTSNGGVTWINKNCGIENDDDLDDLYFFDENNGFVVGENIYKLSNSKVIYSKNEMNFGFNCIPDDKYDTLTIKNKSFNYSNFTLNLLSGSIADYQIIQPNSPLNIGPCDSVKVIVKFHPTSTGIKNAVMRIISNGVDYKDFNLNGTGLKSNVQNLTGDIIIDKMVCGTKKDTLVSFSCDNDLEEFSLINIEYGNSVNCNTSFPLKLTKNGNKIDFTIFPKDTGWNYTTFKVRLEPCGKEYLINFKVYGISSIINATSPRNIVDFCSTEILDTIPIWNTGNDKLIINNAYFLNSNFKVIGFLGKKNFPDTIAIKSYDSLVIKFTPPYLGKTSANLIIINNDSTKNNGNKNPFNINFIGEFYQSQLSIKDSIFDLGDICLNGYKEFFTLVKNRGNMKSYFRLKNKVSNYQIYSTPNDFPIPLDNNDSTKIYIQFSATKLGIFKDTLNFYSDECNQFFKIIIKGRVVNADAEIDPKNISIILQANVLKNEIINIKSLCDIDLNVKSIKLKPILPNINFSYNLTNGNLLKSRDSLYVEFSFISKFDTIYDATICIEFDGFCNAEKCFPIKIITKSNWTEIDRTEIDYGLILCPDDSLNQKLTIKNLGGTNDTITSINILPNNSYFSLINPPTLPYIIKPNEDLILNINFNYPKNGIFNDSIIIHTKNFSTPFVAHLKAVQEFSMVLFDINGIDFGTKEKCQLDTIIQFTFYNKRNLADSIHISRKAPIDEFSIIDKTSFEIKGNDSVKISFKLSPTLGKKLGFNSERILVKLSCNENSYFDIFYKLIEPKLTTNQQILDFGTLWVGDSLTKSFTINNPSKYDINLLSINTNPYYINYELDKTLPLRILAGKSEDFNIKFKSLKNGNYDTKLNCQFSSICKDSISIDLKANTPKEEYIINIETGEYQTKPGESITVNTWLKDSVYHLHPEEIEFKYTYDKYLFIPGIVSSNTNSIFNNVIFSDNTGELSFKLNGTQARNFFEKADTMIKIDGVALLSVPTKTLLSISSIKIKDYQNYYLVQKDGSLEIIEFCYPTGMHKMKLISGFYIKSMIINSKSCDLIINSTEEFLSKIEIYDILSQKVCGEIINLLPGDNDKSIDINDLPSGVYFIKIGYNFEKFIKY